MAFHLEHSRLITKVGERRVLKQRLGSDSCSVGDKNQFELQLCHSFGYHLVKELSSPNPVLGDNRKVAGGLKKFTCTSQAPSICFSLSQGHRKISKIPLATLDLRRSREKQIYGKENWSGLLALEVIHHGARRADGGRGS